MRSISLLTLAALLAGPVAAQRPTGIRGAIVRADAAVDSSQLRVEIGADTRALKTGDSLPADVRLGYAVSKSFTLEASVAARQDSDSAQGNYIEADVALGVTAALFPGSTNYHGQFVFASPLLHYEGSDFQFGAKFGTGVRQVASASAGMLARLSAGVEHLFARGAEPSKNLAYVEIGISFLK